MSDLEAAKEILDKFGVAHHHWCVSCAEIIDRLAVQPAVAAERKRAEGLRDALEYNLGFHVPADHEQEHDGEYAKELCPYCTALKALADYESNAPVPTEETGVRELVRVLSRIMEDLPTKRDWLDPMIEISANTLLSKYKGV